MQTMLVHINQSNFSGIKLDMKELKCCQLADDTTIFLKKNGKEVKKAIECLKTFSEVSGLTVNIGKCDLFALKEKPKDLLEIGGIPIKDVVSYLGIKICKNQKERANMNLDPLVKKWKRNLNFGC